MAGSDRRFTLVVMTAFAALASIAFIISNLAYLDLGGSYDSLSPSISSVTMSVVYVLLAITLCAIIYLLYYYFKFGRPRGKSSAKAGNPAAMLISIFVVIAVIGIFSFSGGHMNPLTNPSSQQSGASGGQGDASSGTTSGGSAFILVVFIAVAIIGILIGSRYIRTRPMRESVATERYEQDQAAQILDQAMKELYAGEDTRAVIVRTYQQMCRLIGGSTLGNSPFMTPHEFANLAVQRWKWPDGPVMTLTSLFEEAWYSEHSMDEAKKDTAMRCLEQLKSGPANNRSPTGDARTVPRPYSDV